MSAHRWIPGNRVELLENGETFFPRVFEAIRQARREVIVETFILFEDKIGLGLHAALCEAARHGVKVDLMIDGFGSPDLSAGFLGALAEAGVKVRVFDPGRRLHRGQPHHVLVRRGDVGAHHRQPQLAAEHLQQVVLADRADPHQHAAKPPADLLLQGQPAFEVGDAYQPGIEQQLAQQSIARGHAQRGFRGHRRILS